MSDPRPSRRFTPTRAGKLLIPLLLGLLFLALVAVIVLSVLASLGHIPIY